MPRPLAFHTLQHFVTITFLSKYVMGRNMFRVAIWIAFMLSIGAEETSRDLSLSLCVSECACVGMCERENICQCVCVVCVWCVWCVCVCV